MHTNRVVSKIRNVYVAMVAVVFILEAVVFAVIAFTGLLDALLLSMVGVMLLMGFIIIMFSLVRNLYVIEVDNGMLRVKPFFGGEQRFYNIKESFDGYYEAVVTGRSSANYVLLVKDDMCKEMFMIDWYSNASELKTAMELPCLGLLDDMSVFSCKGYIDKNGYIKKEYLTKRHHI